MEGPVSLKQKIFSRSRREVSPVPVFLLGVFCSSVSFLSSDVNICRGSVLPRKGRKAPVAGARSNSTRHITTFWVEEDREKEIYDKEM